MKVYRSLSDVQLTDSAIAIGVFDGVHRGHQEVLRRARDASNTWPDGTSLTMTFDRHPAEVVAPRHAPMYISSLDQRIEMVDDFCPTDAIVIIPFDLKFANLSPQTFVKSVLVDSLGARLILVGADFRYGKDRMGSAMDLEAAGDRFGFGVSVVHSVADAGERVSSTRIRELVAEGHIAAANLLLGHPFTIRGTVIQGKQLGRTIGFPTANVSPEEPRQLLPVAGVYAAMVRLPTDKFAGARWPAAVSVGLNPTTDIGNIEVKIEAYLMEGFSDELYGETVEIEFIDFVRHEEKFESLSLLVAQIERDVITVNSILDR